MADPTTLVWRWPPASRKAHIFEEQDARSLCGGWLYTGSHDEQPVGELGEKPGRDDCTPCWRAAGKRR